MDVSHELDVVIVVVGAGDVVGRVVVVRADVNHHEVGGFLLLKIPLGRVIAVDLRRAPGCVASAVPLVCLLV